MKFEDKVFSNLKKKKPNEVDLKVANIKEPKYFHLNELDFYNFVKNRLLYMKTAYLELLNIEERELMPLHFVSTKPHYIYGMIEVVDSNNIYIFSNIDGNNDLLLKLNLDFIDRYSLFTGQVVVLKGKNIGTNEFIVDNIQCIPMVDINSESATGPCKIRIISGEMKDTDTDNIDVLILIGVDVIKFKDKLESFVKSNKSNNVIVVPTLGDDMSINVYPQIMVPNISPLFTVLTNPGEIQLNGRLININTFDILSTLKKEEISYCKRTVNGVQQTQKQKEDPCGEALFGNDLIERLCYHALFQKTFIPAIPETKNIQ